MVHTLSERVINRLESIQHYRTHLFFLTALSDVLFCFESAAGSGGVALRAHVSAVR